MALNRQAKVLSDAHLGRLLAHVEETRTPLRDRVIVLLSFRAGLRAIEIASLRWRMVTTVDGTLAATIALDDRASKGKSGGRSIAMKDVVEDALADLQRSAAPAPEEFVIHFQKGSRDRVTRSTSIQVLFRRWFRELGYHGASSHSGRRTFGTEGSKKASALGISPRVIQRLLGHKSLETTQRYFDHDERDARRIVEAL